MHKLQSFIDHLDNLAISLIIFAVSIVLGLLLNFILFKLIGMYNRTSNPLLVSSVNRRLRQPLTFLTPLLFVSIALPTVPLSPGELHVLRRVIEILNIIAFAWLLIRVVSVVQDMVRHKYAIDKADNFRERKLVTQLQFVRKLSVMLILFFAVSLVLLQFEAVRTLGTGLLTSAGIAGVVLGFAAQRSLANLLAGLQIAFTQPIRIDDVLVVENEFGRVEEITLTYVVLRLWDNRRLILPLNYLIEKPFQNWTRTSTEILATVYFYTDYNVPVEELRKELSSILSASKLWNGEVAGLQVTDILPDTVQLRALFSAYNSGEAWDLRCLVREKLLYFIQKNYPGSLPKVRASVDGGITANK
ncbi:mechanosensitive ion channel [Pontibacter sp. Tf4]|uniref:mechanosensitive ion channel family protein n=1 Tax=Pontibacter sp. Tf4 TaxID=2761620 RepID=UPI001625ED52|nr:mechanosensitive ion channel domain-containing protein [Pontibacter sp. Tf4]MBB6611728.1 mechanosensitive ion channel [Pontibacter sp. Tf4]